MIGSVGKFVKRTSDVIIGLADSSLVKGASRLGTGALKMGVEGAAGVANKTIDTAKKIAPRLKNIDGKKISDNIGKATHKTFVGLDGDYKNMGKAFNDSVVGKATSKVVGKDVVQDSATLMLGPKNRRTRHVVTNESFGLADALGDRAKSYVDGAVGMISPLIKHSDDTLIGLKAKKRGTALFIGASLVAGTPDAVKKANQNRQGTNFDPSPTSIAPKTPSYANNGGATGDLVFALNNLRHGGMM